jgi:hypothetical protein
MSLLRKPESSALVYNSEKEQWSANNMFNICVHPWKYFNDHLHPTINMPESAKHLETFQVLHFSKIDNYQCEHILKLLAYR